MPVVHSILLTLLGQLSLTKVLADYTWKHLMDVFKKPQKICKGTPSTLQAPALGNPPARVYQFDSFLLDQNERILLCGTTRVALPPKVFDVLSVLIESAG